MRALDIGIIGGGTAGCAAGTFLARDGHAVTIYERVPDPKPIGAGITLQPTGLAVLEALGLRDAVVARGARIHHLRCETKSGRKIVDLAYRDVHEEIFGLGIHRGVIFENLHRAAREAGARMIHGAACENLRRARTKTKALTIVDAEDSPLGTHELVIVADGARSHFRDDTVIKKSVVPYPWGALWFVGKSPSEAASDLLYQVTDGNRRMLGMLPTGKGPGLENEAPLVSLFYSIRADRIGAWRSRGLDAWKAECIELAPRAAPVVEQIERAEDVLFSQYFDVEMYPWNTKNVVYLGDAAHAMSPQLGQGCNLALMDAMVLARSIAAHSHLTDALDSYSRTRRAHLGFYQWATRTLTPFFQGDEEWFGILRDLGMPIMMAIPWVKRMMTLSMCGRLLSPFGRELEL